MKRTIELDDKFYEAIQFCIDDLKEKIIEHGRLDYEYIQEDVFEIADHNTPVYTYDLRVICFLYPEIEEEFYNNGFSLDDSQYQCRWRCAAVCLALESEMQKWLQNESEEWWENYKKEHENAETEND